MSFISDAVDTVFGPGDTNAKTNKTDVTTQTGNIDTKTSSAAQTQSTQATGSTQASTTNSTQNQSGKVQALSDDVLAAGGAVIKSLSSAATPADLSSIVTRIQGVNNQAASAATELLSRAQAGDAGNAANIDAIVGGAQVSGEKANQAQQTKVAQGAGSQFNSLVQSVFASGNKDLNVQLAALRGTLSQQFRQQSTQELVSAVTALNQVGQNIFTSETGSKVAESSINANNAGAVSNAIYALKGGLTTSDVNTTGSSSTLTELQQTINTLQNTTTNTDENKGINLNTGEITIGDSSTNNPTGLAKTIDLLNGKD